MTRATTGSVSAIRFTHIASLGLILLGTQANRAGAQAALAKGRMAFQACAACHSDKPGITRLGPSLAGIFGKDAAQTRDFNYSPALKSAKLRWDRRTLDAFIADPAKIAPGTRMRYPGVSDPAKREAIIDYLERLH